MTQISGKIYQMKNAAGTENRFPRTVMEAVLGLNTYLQQQFNALADIYMPIEGISEALTDQEFVYRISPNTIKAKSLTLDRILGRTLAWNQFYNFEPSSFVIGTSGDFTTEIDGDAIKLTCNASGYESNATAKQFATSRSRYYQKDHLYLWKAQFKTQNAFCRISVASNVYEPILSSEKWATCAVIGPWTSSVITQSVMPNFYIANCQEGGSLWINNIMVIDLTLMFGAGNEPSTVEEFEALYPGYHDYSAGKLISNDASEIETVGRNVWDEECGYNKKWNDNTGELESSLDRLYNLNPIPVVAGAEYYAKTGSGYIYPHFYDGAMNYIGRGTTAEVRNQTFTVPTGACYMNFHTYNYNGPYNHDICINLSDASFNGQYEPYRKSTLHLGLNNIRVKSHNIWDEEWENGIYNQTTGEKEDSPSIAIRATNYIPIKGGEVYYFKASQTVRVFYYDASKSYLSTATANGEFTPPSNAAYMTFQQGNTSTYNNDICINVSSSFNGQYEPHGILTITGGVRSADDNNYNEIVGGNKYIMRVKEVDWGTLDWQRYMDGRFKALISDAKDYGNNVAAILLTATRYTVVPSYTSLGDGRMSFSYNSDKNLYVVDSGYADKTAAQWKADKTGVKMNYVLATPIEYELAEPLVPTVKAGTTEARISPNADGLSAPFRADITYSASENNDAATSQYAATAGRLINAQTIWGQTFDGSDSVSGAMSGVTTLDASGAITAGSFVKSGGTASQFLKANGTVDSTAYFPLAGNITVTGSYNLANNVAINSYLSNGSLYAILRVGTDDNTLIGPGVGTTTIRSGATNLVHSKNGTDYTIWDSGNSNRNTVDWTAKDLTLAGTITGATSIDSLLYFDTTNNRVGIGTQVATALLDVRGTASFLSNYFNGTTPALGALGEGTIAFNCRSQSGSYTRYGMFVWVDWGSGVSCLQGGYSTGLTTALPMSLQPLGGKVGIGNLAPAHTLDVSGTFRATGNSLIGGTLGVTGATTLSSTLAVTGNTTLGGNLYVGTSASNKILSVYGDSNMMGKVYVGKDEASAPCFVLDADSQEGLKIKPDTAATNHYMHLSTAGVLTVTDGIVCNAYITAGAASVSSDRSMKDNISAIPTDKALSILSSLKGAEWDWNEKSGLYGQHGSGLVAQEVQKVMPWAVLELNDKLSLNYNSLWGIAIPVIQALVERIEKLEKQLNG